MTNQFIFFEKYCPACSYDKINQTYEFKEEIAELLLNEDHTQIETKVSWLGKNYRVHYFLTDEEKTDFDSSSEQRITTIFNKILLNIETQSEVKNPIENQLSNIKIELIESESNTSHIFNLIFETEPDDKLIENISKAKTIDLEKLKKIITNSFLVDNNKVNTQISVNKFNLYLSFFCEINEIRRPDLNFFNFLFDKTQVIEIELVRKIIENAKSFKYPYQLSESYIHLLTYLNKEYPHLIKKQNIIHWFEENGNFNRENALKDIDKKIPVSTTPTLRNLGNSCYIASSLQLFLLSKDIFYNKILQILENSDKVSFEINTLNMPKISVIMALKDFYDGCDEGNTTKIQEAINDLREAIFDYGHPEFTPEDKTRQMDSNAFISLVMEVLNEGIINRQTTSNNSIVTTQRNELLPFVKLNLVEQVKQEINLDAKEPKNECETTATSTYTSSSQSEQNPATSKPLNLEPKDKEKSLNLQELIFAHFSKEPIENTNLINENNLLIEEGQVAPKFVFVQLLRHSYDVIHQKSKKLDTKIIFPENRQLNLPFVNHDPSKFNQANEMLEAYEIIGVQNHQGGSMNSGHYTADVKDSEPGNWTHCDDLKGNWRLDEASAINERDSYFLLLKKR